jgi:hypothetical protein
VALVLLTDRVLLTDWVLLADCDVVALRRRPRVRRWPLLERDLPAGAPAGSVCAEDDAPEATLGGRALPDPHAPAATAHTESATAAAGRFKPANVSYRS